MKKSIIKTAAFLLILFTSLYFTDSALRLKSSDGIYSLTKFYEQDENSIDVLILGSSHAFENFNTGVLWEEQGIASYVLGGSWQPVWNTYYYLKEALKTQKPKLIILEAFRLCEEGEYADQTVTLKNTMGIRDIRGRMEAIKCSAPEGERLKYVLAYTNYHTRYRNLSRADFLEYKGDLQYRSWKGFSSNLDTEAFRDPDVVNDDRKALGEKSEKYYRMILELAKEEGIPVLVAVAPYAGMGKGEYSKFNTAADIAEEYGVSFLNGGALVSDMGIDWESDAGDDSHLNFRGNVKFTSYIGNYIKTHYDIPDRRGDDRYLSWDENALYIKCRMHDRILSEEVDKAAFFESLQNGSYVTYLIAGGNTDEMDEDTVTCLNDAGILPNAEGIWIRGTDGVTKCVEKGKKIFFSDSVNDISAIWNDDGMQVYFGREGMRIDGADMTVMVYDTVTGRMAAHMGFAFQGTDNMWMEDE